MTHEEVMQEIEKKFDDEFWKGFYEREKEKYTNYDSDLDRMKKCLGIEGDKHIAIRNLNFNKCLYCGNEDVRVCSSKCPGYKFNLITRIAEMYNFLIGKKEKKSRRRK